MKDILALTQEDIKGMGTSLLREKEVELRKQLSRLRMDVYQSAKSSGEIKKLKKTLARFLTQVRVNEDKQNSGEK